MFVGLQIENFNLKDAKKRLTDEMVEVRAALARQEQLINKLLRQVNNSGTTTQPTTTQPTPTTQPAPPATQPPPPATQPTPPTTAPTAPSGPDAVDDDAGTATPPPNRTKEKKKPPKLPSKEVPPAYTFGPGREWAQEASAR